MSKMPDGPPPAYPYDQGQQGPPPAGFVQPGPGYGGYPGSPPVTQQPHHVVTVIQNMTLLSFDSQRMTCPHCQADMSTNVSYDSGSMAHIIALVLCVFGCWFGCCCIPYCVDGCKDATHTCSNCKRVIGIAKRLR